jgi:hypothetical protein
MKLDPIRLSALVTGACATLVLTGCSKESTDASVETAPAAAPVEVQANQPAPVAPVQAQAQDARLRESQAAIASGQYEQAAAALVAAQQMQLNQQQAELVAKQMQQLQRSLAGAVASGDPRAKAAADKLRQSATVR